MRYIRKWTYNHTRHTQNFCKLYKFFKFLIWSIKTYLRGWVDSYAKTGKLKQGLVLQTSLFRQMKLNRRISTSIESIDRILVKNWVKLNLWKLSSKIIWASDDCAFYGNVTWTLSYIYRYINTIMRECILRINIIYKIEKYVLAKIVIKLSFTFLSPS